MEAPAKKNWFVRHKIWTAIIALIVIIGIAGAASGGTNNNNTSTNSAQNASASASHSSGSASTAKIGQPARDGKFEFTITKFSCGDTEVTQPDDPDINSQAQGQFCQMSLNVKNIGNVAQDFDASSQYIYDSSGKQYSYSSDATITANPSGSQFAVFETVNPGNSVSGVVVFDIPKGVTPISATLHDSAASGGVKVNLQQ